MTLIVQRRGKLRPIRDLPDLVGDAVLVEVEDGDGNPAKAAFPTGGGDPFPDDPAGYGTVHVDDEEWNAAADIARWTVEAAPIAPSTYVVNDTFAPSRLQVRWGDSANFDYLSLYRLPTLLNLATDFSITFDAALGSTQIATGGPLVGIGTRISTLAASGGNLLCVTENGGISLRNYSNFGAGTFSNAATFNLATGLMPLHLYLHIERHGANSWCIGYCLDGTSWKWSRGIAANGGAMTLLQILIKKDNVNAPNRGSNNWMRVNRYFLATT